MVTLYRKTPIKNNYPQDIGLPNHTDQPIDDHEADTLPSEVLYQVMNADDELPYVVVTPKAKRNNGHNKVRRMRHYWDL